MRLCRHCQRDIDGMRPDAVFCSENCRKRNHEEMNRQSCADCGEPCGAGSGYPSHSGGGLCVDCTNLRRAERQHVRSERIERLWAEGKTYKEIQAIFGWSRGSLSREMDRARASGYDLPYRHFGSYGIHMDDKEEAAA